MKQFELVGTLEGIEARARGRRVSVDNTTLVMKEQGLKMSLVLDAGVLVKLVLEKKGSAETRRLIRSAILSGLEIHESDLALSKALNTIWRHTCLVRDLKEEEGRDATLDLLRLWSKLEIHPAERLASEALDLAFGEKVTFYDSVYLALARGLNATLVTFDGITRERAKKLGIKTEPQITGSA